MTKNQKITELMRQFNNTAYLIFDAGCMREFIAFFQSLDAESDYVSLFSHTKYQHIAEAPYLFKLKARAKFLQWALSNAGQPAQFILLFSAAPLDALHQHYRNLVQVTLPNARQVQFRFYDPNILHPFLNACTEHEKNVWMGPAQHILAENQDDYALFSNPYATDPKYNQQLNPGITAPPSYWWGMQAHHLAAFKPQNEKILVSNIHYFLWNHFSAMMAQYPKEDLPIMIRHSLTKARRYGVIGEQGLTCYVLMMLTVHPQFDQDPAVRNFLQNNAPGPPDRRIKMAMDKIPTEIWDAIRAPDLADAWRRTLAGGLT